MPLSPGARPSSLADVPLKLDAQTRGRLVAVTDGRLLIAYDPKGSSFDSFFAGSTANAKLYAQRVSGGGKNGDNFDMVFWDPRAKARWQAGFGRKDGKVTLQCGDKEIPLTATKLPSAASFHQPRWQRRLVALARSETLVRFVVDQAREPEQNSDYRVWVLDGERLSWLRVKNAALEADEQIFITDAGRLKLAGAQSSWTPDGGGAVPLKMLDLEENAGDAYGKWKIYADADGTSTLGTPCDAFLGR